MARAHKQVQNVMLWLRCSRGEGLDVQLTDAEVTEIRALELGVQNLSAQAQTASSRAPRLTPAEKTDAGEWCLGGMEALKKAAIAHATQLLAQVSISCGTLRTLCVTLRTEIQC